MSYARPACIRCLLAASLSAPCPAMADELWPYYAQSLNQVWAASQQCQNAFPLASGYYGGLISGYVKQLYNGDVPYWAHPPSRRELFQNRDRCVTELQRSLLRYEGANQQLRQYYGRLPVLRVASLENIMAAETRGTQRQARRAPSGPFYLGGQGHENGVNVPARHQAEPRTAVVQ